MPSFLTELTNTEQQAELFRKFFEAAPYSIALTDAITGQLLDINPAFEQKTGYGRDEVIGRTTAELLLRADKSTAHQLRNKLLSSGQLDDEEITIFSRDDDRLRVLLSSRLINIDDRLLALTICVDITDRYHFERDQALAAQMFGSSSEGICILDAEYQLLRGNERYWQMTGQQESEALHRRPGWHIGLEGRLSIWPQLPTNGGWSGELYIPAPDGNQQLCWAQINAVPSSDNDTRYVAVFSNQHHELPESIYQLSHYDLITKLPNRFEFIEQLSREIDACREHRSTLAVITVDLDNFKGINESYGLSGGDMVLQMVSQRLSRLLGELPNALIRHALAARIGGDEFAVMLSFTRRISPEQVSQTGEQLKSRLLEPMALGEDELIVTPCLGISLYPDDAGNADALLNRASKALSIAKRNGPNSIAFYAADMNRQVSDQLKLQTQLRYALERSEFELFFQPKVELSGQQVVGAEALLRWNHPERGIVPPGMFIEILETSDLIYPVGHWVLEQAFRTVQQWHQQQQPCQLAVNISPKQLLHRDFLNDVERLMQRYPIPPQLIELEVTEALLLSDVRQAGRILNALKQLGFIITLDDFGTGYSSLNYITHLPFDVLKIDRSFVDGLPNEKRSVAVVSAVLALAQSLDLQVVAEGIEEPHQQQALLDLHCALGQGYLFSRPLPQAEFEQYLAQSPCTTSGTPLRTGSKR
ncbi:sensor domain-containing protein [Marinobacterium arenosum]|uniref:sensor domain-containing protein n=1 Tax=Marinobacterium arenosum TaxID=2862496 RepID=UPI001C9666A9|nr:bifunctional diguanylate cyclase/phosphodiesterase [Marinobacterium arenosum]MBY4678432.1 EAL domain-containing protein [Marinobacterium arenosum]